MADKQVREPIATWWRIKSYGFGIERLRVVAFTECFITYLEKAGWTDKSPLRERRERREGCFPSFADAKTEYLRRANQSVEWAKKSLQDARTRLGQVESLKEPAED